MAVVHETHVIYKVQSGDTLYSIAARFGSTENALRQANAIYPPITDVNLIYPGWTLAVPTPSILPNRTIYIVAQGDTLYSIAYRFAAHPDLLIGINKRIQNPNLIFPGQSLWVPAFMYEVVQGDTLTRISQHLGVPINTILVANQSRPGLSGDLIYPGYRLIIPLPSSRNIVVTRPFPGDTVCSGQQVEGFARVFEANVMMQLVDANNEIISNERFTTATEGAPAYGYFSAALPFDKSPTARSGELWVYDRSAKDGSITDLVQVQVYFNINSST
ncbi:LysM peptidoglycan-binding domain-containing protein [Paenibacillus eucommiae]|uniref:LysM repeat protein n=1 Tax=Paenibacillus eucommiae TaxID=1355755 RepID=A0ABS4IU80_9BACL|nr:LysM peptidoglycan-binding domain-containing protein [Paenibacillus eucommiae]MBP1991127.1 LysM repeat protein [Paenibacillus eucommiae]